MTKGINTCRKTRFLETLNSFSLWLARACLFVGIVLLAINFAGLAMGESAFYKKENSQKVHLSNYSLLEKEAGESDTKYAYRMNTLINSHLDHYFYPRNTVTFTNFHHPLVPIWDNYLIWGKGGVSFLFDKPQYYIEFKSAERALHRGYGFCSQASLALVDLLNRNGINAKAMGLDGHVVVTAEPDGTKMVLDPDYGVVLPFSLDAVQNNPELLRPYYSDAQHESVAPIYLKKFSIEYQGRISKQKVEKLYVLKWVIPILLLLPFIFHKTISHYIGGRRKRHL